MGRGSILIVMGVLLFAPIVAAKEKRKEKRKIFDHSIGVVYQAALRVAEDHYTIEFSDPQNYVLTFHTAMDLRWTMTSAMEVTVSFSTSGEGTLATARTETRVPQLVGWGGGRIVDEFFSQLSAALRKPGELKSFPLPGELTQTFTWEGFSLRYPENWRVLNTESYWSGDGAMIGPEGGAEIPIGKHKHRDIHCGITVLLVTNKHQLLLTNKRIQSQWTGGKLSFEKIVKNMREVAAKDNPGLTQIQGSERSFTIAGRQALEVGWIYAPASERGSELYVDDERGILVWDFVAPDSVYPSYSPVFSKIAESIRFEGATTGTASSSAAQPPPLKPSSQVSVLSSPDGADILIDGKYMGSTPSTIVLTAGSHTISIQESGYRPWDRTLALVSGSKVTVDARLEKQ